MFDAKIRPAYLVVPGGGYRYIMMSRKSSLSENMKE